jgi:membrane-associated phospholipid phosphatase
MLAGMNRSNAVRSLGALLTAQDAIPCLLIATIVVGSIAWNELSGLAWIPPSPWLTVLVPTFVFGCVAVLFSTVFSNRTVVELATYFALWAAFPIFGVRLNYLAATLDFPLQDKFFAHLDAAVGFDWLTWASIAWSHPVFIKILIWAYRSNIYQPFFVIAFLAIWGARGRNRELLTATLFSYLLTVAIFAILPAFGPQRAFGIPSEWDSVLSALRNGTHTLLPYVGIVSFPSFHSSMAITLAASMRGNRYLFAAASILNALMLIATVPIGYHYLIDVVAGVAIGLASLYAVRLLENRRILAPAGRDQAVPG